MKNQELNIGKAIDFDFNKSYSEFPFDVFPISIQNLIQNASNTVGFNKEYLSAGILSTCATAIGNDTKLFNGSYTSKPILWLAIIGRSGIGKSHPIEFSKQPIENKDKRAYVDFKDLLKDFEQQESKGSKPRYSKHILKDFTPEKLADTLQYNEKGVLIFKDELIGWINSFDQYKKGGDQQLYLELFNGGTLTVDRVTKEPIRVEETNVNIIGGLQPSVLKKLAGNNRGDDGFLARFLFIYPTNPQPFLFTGDHIQEIHLDNYSKLINNLYEASSRILRVPKVIQDVYIDWQHTKVKEYHDDDLETLIQAKLQTYVWRFALILECISQSASHNYSENISIKSLKDAIKLAEYFRLNAFKVNERMLIDNPLDELPLNKLDLYKELPVEFKRIDVLPLFDQFKVKGGSINRFLKSKLFTVPKYGCYKKKYI